MPALVKRTLVLTLLLTLAAIALGSSTEQSTHRGSDIAKTYRDCITRTCAFVSLLARPTQLRHQQLMNGIPQPSTSLG